ncbi:MAG: hypothetical protein HQK58_09030 [Deltaproteobacteria bacterium]|nr:hypothetical protein [Deltaproteobacteria bacterium]
MPKEILPEDQLEPYLLTKLQKAASDQGLTYAQVGQKCGKKWTRALARTMKLVAEEAGVLAIKDLIYTLWARGRVFVEPPHGRLKAPRVWDLDSGLKAFPLVSPRAAQKADTQCEDQDIKNAYQKSAAEYFGFVPIYILRRELGWPREKFDRALFNLNERDNPVIDLLSGDPQNYTPDQKEDSIRKGNDLYLQILWREE